MEHVETIESKQGREWTNDLGQTFPAAPLYRSTCSCGWKGMAWYADPAKASSHFKRHEQAA